MNPDISIIDILFPKTCAVCNAKDTVLCHTCKRSIPDNHPQCFICKKQTPFGKTCTPCQPKTAINYFYPITTFQKSSISTILHAFKYRFVEDIQFHLSYIMLNKIIPLQFHTNSFFTCVPLHKRDFNKRGFNQSQLLAQNIAAICDRPFMHTLTKTTATKKQANLSKDDRLKNIDNCFSIKTNMNFPTDSCIIIDDVKTTGTTLNQAATELKKSNINKIIAITLAS